MEEIKIEIVGGTQEQHKAIESVLSSAFAATPEESPEVKAKGEEFTAWSDEELDAMTDNLSEEDVKRALGTSTPEMRALVTATPVYTTEQYIEKITKETKAAVDAERATKPEGE